jgi:hypothetical protein
MHYDALFKKCAMMIIQSRCKWSQDDSPGREARATPKSLLPRGQILLEMHSLPYAQILVRSATDINATT